MGKPKGCKGHQINRWRKKSNRAITPEPLGVNYSLSMNEGWGSGVQFYHLQAEERLACRRMLLVKYRKVVLCYTLSGNRLSLFMRCESTFLFFPSPVFTRIPIRRELHARLPDFENFPALDVHPGDSRILFTGGSAGPAHAQRRRRDD